MKRILPFSMALLAVGMAASWQSVMAFCGFYVAKADTKLFNQASKVVIARDGERTVLTLSNDFQGEPKEFAIVIPVPTFLEKGQIHVGDSALIDHLDAYSSPRLVEYYDPNPCMQIRFRDAMPAAPMKSELQGGQKERANQLGVKIEAQYTVGEYDILILSAEQSDGLATWLQENGYKLPKGAASVLGSYIKQNMRFFVAKVNLEEQSKLGFKYLRPLQVAYESPKYMLPIRLGTLNAHGDQELFIFNLTRKGRVETTNYRTVKLPEGMDIPEYVKDEFAPFYKDLFSQQVKREDGKAVFLEYAWDMNWCDPCAADPLTRDELKKLGVFWQEPGSQSPGILPRPGGAQDVFLTRLHLRYNRDNFPEDLVFQETPDRSNFQGRYVLRHPYTGGDSCPAMEVYKNQLRARQEKEAETLAQLTGWDLEKIRARMKLEGEGTGKSGEKWWEKVW
ncbi:MAG: DUF2330 domain-containing protein [Methylococcaceae bacterium]|nr:DUF2330 domain-containing protein [Methylococcaceae bacterium]